MIDENAQTIKLTKKYKYSDATALVVSILTLTVFILDSETSLNYLITDSFLGLFSYFFIFYYTYERKKLLKIPNIILIVIGGSILWFFLKNLENVVVGRGVFSFEDLNAIPLQMVLFFFFSIIFIPITIIVTSLIISFFRLLIYISNLKNK